MLHSIWLGRSFVCGALRRKWANERAVNLVAVTGSVTNLCEICKRKK